MSFIQQNFITAFFKTTRDFRDKLGDSSAKRSNTSLVNPVNPLDLSYNLLHELNEGGNITNGGSFNYLNNSSTFVSTPSS